MRSSSRPGVEAYYEIQLQADPRRSYGEVPVLLAPSAAAARLMVPGSVWVVLDSKQQIRARGSAHRVNLLQPAHFGHRDQSDRRIVITPIGGS